MTQAGGQAIAIEPNGSSYIVSDAYATAEVDGGGPIVCVPPAPPTHSPPFWIPPADWRPNGYCGVYATWRCDNALSGSTSSTISKAAWDALAVRVKTSTKTGGTSTADIAKYYEGRGYCVEYIDYSSFSRIVDAVKPGNDVKAVYTGPNSSHIEQVISATKTEIKTYSWTSEGTVTSSKTGAGGDGSGFGNHNRYPGSFNNGFVMVIKPCPRN